jgi:hypothetical protein
MARTFANSTGDRLTLASSAITAAPLTISCWLKLTAPSASGRVVVDIKNSAAASSGRNSFMLAMNSTETFLARTGVASAASVSGNTAVISAGVWYHVAATFASATSRYAWLDGVATTQGTTSRVPAGINQITIGCEQYASGTFITPWHGEIAEVAVWNAALEDSPGATPGASTEIAMLSKGASPLLVRPQNLVYYWPVVGQGAGPEIDLISAAGVTVTGTANAPHPRIILPRRNRTIFIGASGAAYTKSVSGVLTPAGGLIKETRRTLTGQTTAAGALVRSTSRTLTGSTTPTGTLNKLTSRLLTGSATASGALSTMLLFTKSVAGSITPAGSVGKAISRAIAGSITPAGAVNKALSRTLSGSLTLSGQVFKSTQRLLTGSITATGVSMQTFATTLTGAITAAGALVSSYIPAAPASTLGIYIRRFWRSRFGRK